ncbi:CHAT domain-containing protein [Tumebacillus permanentifrigoris]|uniref:CHAT domain-containing protein n=1 Tax=Tumebacillus permanentifrigoris TaxID=378543 RepID=A0A316D9R7_9BACL|nr:CHAT domain-containing protein [Tumebacillus permanentifrigoris]PWK08478.1 CHAT domain-containing protein [Tumebacillus permanentifrigoris]
MFPQKIQQIKRCFSMINSPIAMEAVKCCDELIESPSLEKIKLLYDFSRLVFGVVPLDRYNFLETIVTLISGIILESIDVIQTTTEEKIELFTNMMNINSMMARALSTLGLFGQSWNYQMLAFDPLWKGEREIDYGETTGMWVIAIKQGVFDINLQIVESLSNFFYLSRHMGHNFEFCHQLFDFMSPYINLGNEKAAEEEVECVCYYGGILAMFPKEPTLTKICIALKDQFQIEYYRNPQLSVRIAETLATRFGEVAGEDIIYWARVAQNVPSVRLEPNQKASLMLNELLHDKPLRLQAIKECILSFLNSLDEQISDLLINNLQRQRLSQLINRVISVAYHQGEYSFIVQMAFMWRTSRFGIEFQIPREEVLLVVIPNIMRGSVVYLIWDNGFVKIVTTENSLSLEELYQSRSEFDGSWTVVLDQQASQSPPSPLRHPNYEGSETYEASLKLFYCPGVIATELEKINKPVRLLETSWMNMPLGALIGLQTDLSIATFINPTNTVSYSDIKRVVLWCDPTEDLYYANLEKDSVEKIFTKHGIEVEVFSGEACTPELFLEKYKDPNIDLIWTMCHASFNADDPTESLLVVSKENGISLGRILDCKPDRDQKRLLVLNSCESGMSGQRSDAMGLIGFGPSLSNEQQSVIGHLWTVDSFGATILGILLSIHLLGSPSWGHALNRAIKDMSKGNCHVQEILKIHLDHDADVIRLLNNYPIDKLGYWGSVALYE